MVAALALLRRRLPGLAGGVTLRSMSNYYSSLVRAGCRRTEHERHPIDGIVRRSSVAARPLGHFRGRSTGRRRRMAGSLVRSLAMPALPHRRSFDSNWYLEVGGRSLHGFGRAAAQYGQSSRETLSAGALSLSSSGRRGTRGGHRRVPAGLCRELEEARAVHRLRARVSHGRWPRRAGCVWGDPHGRPAAAQLWFVRNCSRLDLQACLRREWRSRGSLATTTLMRHAIDVDRVRQVDYLTGDGLQTRLDVTPSRKIRPHGLQSDHSERPCGLHSRPAGPCLWPIATPRSPASSERRRGKPPNPRPREP